MEKTKPSRRALLLAVAVVATVVIPALLLFVTISSSQPSQTDTISALLPNPNFANGLTGWVAGYAGRDQDVPNQDYVVDIDRSTTYSSTASARIQATATQTTSYGYISTRIPADYFRGKRVRLTAYVRTAWQPLIQPPLAASLYMEVPGTLDGRPTDPAIPMSSDGLLPGEMFGGDWTKRTIVLDIPTQADYLLLGLKVGGNGTAWLDDAKLELVGSDVPTTDRAGKKTLDNLDFEQGLISWLKGRGTEISLDVPDPTSIGTSRDAAHSGQFGAYIRYGQSNANGLHYPTIYGQLYRDKTVRVSAYMNVDKAPEGALLYVEAFYLDPKGAAGPVEYATARALPAAYGRAPSGWQRIAVTLDIPDRTLGMTFGILLDSEGEVWLDDVKLEVVGPSPVEAGTRSEPTAQP
jgi:hypothetical protein